MGTEAGDQTQGLINAKLIMLCNLTVAPLSEIVLTGPFSVYWT